MTGHRADCATIKATIIFTLAFTTILIIGVAGTAPDKYTQKWGNKTESDVQALQGKIDALTKQLAAQQAPINAGHPLLLLSDLTPELQETVFQNYGAEQAIILSQGRDFDANTDGVFDDPAVLEGALEKHVPSGYRGYLWLDWEVPTVTPAGRLKLLKTVQAWRPQACVAFYGLPSINYWGKAFEDQIGDMAPVLDAQGFISPSIYKTYADSDPNAPASMSRDYVKRLAVLSLKAAKGKPVIATMWPAYHPSNADLRFELIPADEFRSYCSAFFEPSLNGDHTDGLAYWDSYNYYRNNATEDEGGPSKPIYDRMIGSADERAFRNWYQSRAICLMAQVVSNKKCEVGPAPAGAVTH